MGPRSPTHFELDAAMGLALASDVRAERVGVPSEGQREEPVCGSPHPRSLCHVARRAQVRVTPAWVLGKHDPL